MYSLDPADIFYFEEAHQRMLYYPPPMGGMYVPPWLWYDGDPHGSWDYFQWETKIVDRMLQPAPVTITMWGNYNPTEDTGTIYAQFRNDSTATIDGRVIFVITEDSLYFMTPYIEWHNQVPRDYLPDHNGEIVSIPPGDSMTVSQPFTIESGWDADFCKILTWIQDDNMQADSTKEILQGGMRKVTDLIPGVEDETKEEIPLSKVNPIPNPCVNGTEFVFDLPAGSAFQIDIYDVSGRFIRTLSGVASGSRESIRWNCRDDTGSLVRAGVYLYRFKSNITNANGKLIVR